jgi:hypothetical protein
MPKTQVYMKHQTTLIMLFNLQQANLLWYIIATVVPRPQAEGLYFIGLPLKVYSLCSQIFFLYKRVHCTVKCINAYVTVFNLIFTYPFVTY